MRRTEALLNIILSIDSRTTNQQEAAHLAFNDVSEYLQLPKQPDDCNEKLIDEHRLMLNRSLFEELALINFMLLEKDIGEMYCLPYIIYIIKIILIMKKLRLFMLKEMTKSLIAISYIFFGDTIDAKISFFLPEVKTWIEAGARLMTKVLDK